MNQDLSDKPNLNPLLNIIGTKVNHQDNNLNEFTQLVEINGESYFYRIAGADEDVSNDVSIRYPNYVVSGITGVGMLILEEEHQHRQQMEYYENHDIDQD